jgi:purine-nucleoside phosphorylase
MMDHVNAAVAFLLSKGISRPDVGVILGTGLGQEFVRKIEEKIEVEYASIPHFPLSTVESHSGRLVFGRIADKTVAVMQGRFHY